MVLKEQVQSLSLAMDINITSQPMNQRLKICVKAMFMLFHNSSTLPLKNSMHFTLNIVKIIIFSHNNNSHCIKIKE